MRLIQKSSERGECFQEKIWKFFWDEEGRRHRSLLVAKKTFLARSPNFFQTFSLHCTSSVRCLPPLSTFSLFLSLFVTLTIDTCFIFSYLSLSLYTYLFRLSLLVFLYLSIFPSLLTHFKLSTLIHLFITLFLSPCLSASLH